jgi:hypothetical protein
LVHSLYKQDPHPHQQLVLSDDIITPHPEFGGQL